jgi:hypothetical protein
VCRLALAPELADAATFTSVRIISGAVPVRCQRPNVRGAGRGSARVRFPTPNKQQKNHLSVVSQKRPHRDHHGRSHQPLGSLGDSMPNQNLAKPIRVSRLYVSLHHWHDRCSRPNTRSYSFAHVEHLYSERTAAGGYAVGSILLCLVAFAPAMR